jgi:hypothetical protein
MRTIGGLWTLLALVQVSTGLRMQCPRVHRRLGYVLFATSFSMLIGLVDIVRTRVGFCRY